MAELRCCWCKKHVGGWRLLDELWISIPPTLTLHTGRYWGCVPTWVCAPCVGQRERLADDISAMHWEIDALERGLDRLALPAEAA